MIIGISGKIGSGKDEVGKIIQYLTSRTNEPLTYEVWEDNLNRNSYTSWKIKKFADKLKDIVCILIGCTRKDLESQEFKSKELGEEWWYYIRSDLRYPELVTLPEYESLSKYQKEWFKLIKLTPRKLLQLLGTECGRKIIHPDIWVNSLLTDYKRPIETAIQKTSGYTNSSTPLNFPNWIITDVRFPNEAEAIKRRDGLLLRINRIYPTMKEINNGDGTITLTSGDPNFGIVKIEHSSETALDDYNFDYTIINDSTIEDLVESVKIILTAEGII